MNGKIINLTPDNLSTGGVFTATAAKTITTLANNLGAADLSVQRHTIRLERSGDMFPSVADAVSIERVGYTPLGIVGHSTSLHWALKRLRTSGNTCYVTLFCDQQYAGSEPSTIPIQVDILYMKD